MEKIQQSIELFKKVEEIIEKEKHLSFLRGESFNVFRLLGLEGNEAGFHTKFLFELLNPQGSHGKGEIFFDEFVRTLNQLLPLEKNIPDGYKYFNEVKKEIHVGRVNHQDKEGGIIDLYFETDSFALAIENKVYSGLGYLQLERYNQFLSTKTNKSQFLILLSPFEYKYSGELKEQEHFYHMKYEHMIPWLEFCMEKSADFPILRETIKQYIISVKGILGMLTNDKMNEDLKELIFKNYETARQIAETFHQAKDLRIRKMYEIVLNKLKEEFSQTIWSKDLDVKTIDSTHWGFWIAHINWPNNLKILFQGNPELTKGMIPTVQFDRVNDEVWAKLVKQFPRKAKRWPDAYVSQIQYAGKFKDLNQLINSEKNHEQIAQEIFEYVVETVDRLEKDILKIEEILKQ